ncbi:flagellar filament capping protein FliD [Clostridium sp. 'deep sea']|uniref:flagellar filament capping protein FliD n=1 Tax=Clostridium sp. 'deep sea' TaxID=2779445 RepID=UPI0018966183|nr:flagellar filament capping protein FliD [Clostridium sp. 'deep sea']QOR35368.1 flagellar filament capping protein FliD [Clostridium sp. 'deep sea']
MGNNISAYSKYNGISGLASGLDTENIIKKLLSKDQAGIDKLNANKQKETWTQEIYHSVMSKFKTFSKKYFDVLSSDTYLFSKGSNKKVVTSNIANNSSSFVEITAKSQAAEGSHTINAITQLATSTTVVSTGKVANGLNGTKAISFPLTIPANTSFGIALDGAYCEVPLAAGTFNSADDLVTGLNNYFNQVFGTDRIQASATDGKISFNSQNSVVQVFDGTTANNFLETLGMKNGQKNIVNLDSSVSDSLGETSSNIKFKINGQQFEFSNTTSMRKIMDTINNSKANVTMTYSSLNDNFTIKTKDTGAVSAVMIENQEGNLFGTNSKINITQNIYANGKDAMFYLDDPSKASPITRSDNNFTIDGVRYSLKEVTNEAISYEISQDTEGMIDTIKTFVSDFNELISSLEAKVSEKIYKDYQPLTAEQKKEMTENQIKLWEEKAKSGLVKYDSTLNKIVDDLKDAFWSKIEGASTTLYEAGITTTKNYNKFEIAVDETKLKEAIQKDAQSVWDLFNKEGDIDYSRRLDSEQYAQRQKENGFAQRISDIIESNISTFRDDYDLKGILVEKAGVDGDASQKENTFSKNIEKLEKRVKEAIKRMNTKEQSYWRRFTAMERALSQLNTQSSWLASQFSGQ